MNLRIGVVGSGAIRSYYGAKLATTLLDWEAGKPLEIEAIWGEPLRRAAASGATMPRLEMVYTLLKALDAKRARPTKEIS